MAKKSSRKPAPTTKAAPRTAARTPKAARKSARTTRAAAPAAARLAPITSFAVASCAHAHDFIHKCTAGFDGASATRQAPGNPNHVLWTYGHLTHSYDWFISMIDGSKGTCPATYNALFGGGSTPTDEPDRYPSLEELKRQYDLAGKRFRLAIANTKNLFAPTAVDSKGWLASKLDAVDRCNWHIGWHTGQITNLRRALGMPGVI